MPAKASQGLHLRHQPEARGDLPVMFRPEPSSPDTTWPDAGQLLGPRPLRGRAFGRGLVALLIGVRLWVILRAGRHVVARVRPSAEVRPGSVIHLSPQSIVLGLARRQPPLLGQRSEGAASAPAIPRISCQCVAWSGDQTTGCAALTVTLVSAVHLAPRFGGTGDGCGCSGRSASRSRASQGRAIAHGSATRTVAKSTLPVAIARAHKRQAQQKFIEDPPVTRAMLQVRLATRSAPFCQPLTRRRGGRIRSQVRAHALNRGGAFRRLPCL
jgi:hypothetical protein